MNLSGRSAIITGASQGFGFSVAKFFLQQGANIAICARNQEQLEIARNELKQYANNSTQIFSQTVDIAVPSQVYNFVEKACNKFSNLNILIANAGIHGPKGSLEEIDWDEWSYAIDVNLKGTVFMCRAVLPYLKKQSYGKIVILSGGGATKPMPNLSAYAVSKAGIVRFAETLAEEVKEFKIDVNAIAPGALNTRLLDKVLEAGPKKVGEAFYQQALKQKNKGGSSLEIGASLCAYLSAPISNGITGKLISAVWDPWQSLELYKKDLAESDVYTLRRIIPQDRGYHWDDKLGKPQ